MAIVNSKYGNVCFFSCFLKSLDARLQSGMFAKIMVVLKECVHYSVQEHCLLSSIAHLLVGCPEQIVSWSVFVWVYFTHWCISPAHPRTQLSYGHENMTSRIHQCPYEPSACIHMYCNIPIAFTTPRVLLYKQLCDPLIEGIFPLGSVCMFKVLSFAYLHRKEVHEWVTRFKRA